MKKFVLLFVSVVTFILCAQSQSKDSTSYSFSLQQAIDYALSNNTRIQNAVLEEEFTKYKVKEILGIGLPQIGGSFDVKDFLIIPTQVIPANSFNPAASSDELMALQFGINYNATASLSASQLLFSAGYMVSMEATKTFLELSKKATKRTKIETIVTISKAYYTAIVNDERMKLINANVVRVKKLLDDTKALNESGFVEKIDFDRVSVAYNNLTVENEKTQRLLSLSLVLLKYQMGMTQSAKLTLSDNLSTITFQPETVSNESNYANRVEYSMVESQKKTAMLQLKKDKLELLPSAVLYANVGTSAMRMQFDIFDFSKKWYPFAIVGGTVNVPIFSGLQKNYRIQQSKVSFQKADNDLKFMQQSIDLEQANARIMLQNASISLDSQKKNIQLAEEVYKVSKLKYEKGVGSNMEVLNAETALKEAQTNYFSALYDALVAKVDYQKSIGTLIK